MTTVSYELSKKLHEKFPAMGEGSYFVHAVARYEPVTEGEPWRCSEPLVVMRAVANLRNGMYEILAPALTLGELVRWCMDNGLCHISLTKVKRGVVVTISHQWNHDVLSSGDADTTENALAQAIIEGGM